MCVYSDHKRKIYMCSLGEGMTRWNNRVSLGDLHLTNKHPNTNLSPGKRSSALQKHQHPLNVYIFCRITTTTSVSLTETIQHKKVHKTFKENQNVYKCGMNWIQHPLL
ncbi:hypothetical protein ILYODFUR_033535 [Ilyodon furcidens]|uniref:Uncharacterized protein n=1 Tax=Ilyodon furcidens TaxID=33524 RepID=A0ABV0V0A9_9TELE